MAITTGDSTDGVRTGLAGRIANDEVAAFPGITYPAGSNHQKGINALAQAVVDALNNDQIDPFSQVAAALPMMGARTTAAQSIPNGAPTIVVYGTVERDTDSAYSSGTGRYTVPAGKGGDYLVTCSIAYSAALPTGGAALYIYKNAALQKGWNVNAPPVNQTMAVTAILNLVAGDIIDCRTAHSEPASKTLLSNAELNYFAIKCLSRT